MNFRLYLIFSITLAMMLWVLAYCTALYAQARRSFPRINYGVIALLFLIFIQSAMQISIFQDEAYLLYAPFPSDIGTHLYIFLMPVLMFWLLVPIYYPTKPKDLFYLQIAMGCVASVTMIYVIPGKDLIWYTIVNCGLLFAMGLRKERAPLHFRYFSIYFVLENTWISLFYFTEYSTFLVGFVLQFAARYYLLQLANLCWASSTIDGFSEAVAQFGERKNNTLAVK